MMISEFLAIVRGATLRGTALDTQAGNAFKQAVRFIERNYSLPYMRRLVTVSGVTSAITLTAADAAQLKSIQRVRWFDSDSQERQIVQIDPDQLVSREPGNDPAGYEFFTSTSALGVVTTTLTLDVPFETATDVEILAYFYSTVDLTLPSDQSLWLLEHATDAVLSRTMINLAPIMRDPTVLQMYQALWQENIGTLIGAVSEAEQGAR